jgi:hypothetical protein
MEDLIKLLKEHIAKNRDFIKLLHQNHLGFLFAEELSELFSYIADRIDPDRISKTSHIANAFIMAAISNSLLVWSQESEVTEDDYVNLLYQILEGKYFTIGDK